MEKARQALKWNQRSEAAQTGFVLVIIIAATLIGFGAFTVVMGTSSPLVVVESQSMIPTLNIGDLLVLQAQQPEDIEIGDIIVFVATWHDKPIVHRVVDRQLVADEYHYFTRGDNNSLNDSGYRVYGDIIGVVVFAIPFIGYVTLFLHQPLGLALVIVILVTLIILPEFVHKDQKDSDEATHDQKVPNV